MNIALVVLDTLRYDAFNRYFDWLPGTRIENTWAPSYWTVPSHASMFTGKYPSELGVHSGNTTLDCPEPTLAECLSDAGYTTHGFTNNVNLTPMSSFDRGFEFFNGGWRVQNLTADTFDWETFISETHEQGIKRYLRGIQRCITEECATWPSLKRGASLKLRDLGVQSQPDDNGARETLEHVQQTQFNDQEFLFVNLMEAHWPYKVPDSYRGARTTMIQDVNNYNGLSATLGDGPPVDAQIIRQAYEESVEYLSDVYERIFTELRDDFDFIITVSDHGESFGEHGTWQHAYGLSPELTHVPVVISGDGIADEGSQGPTTLLDIHQTILSLASVDALSDGCDLLAESDDSQEGTANGEESRVCFTEAHGINQRSAARATADGYDPAVLNHELTGVATATTYGYETADGFSVSETDDRRRNSNSTTDSSELQQHIESHHEQINRRDVSESVETSPALQRQLEALGYA